MARDESSREDLLREATALVERIELVSRSVESQHIVAGFRRDGALSIFFGEDPVFQFNAARELRRAYRQGTLLKAMDGRLISLDRVRTQKEVQLVRRELSDDEQEEVLREMVERMGQLSDLLNTKGFEVVGQVPSDVDVLGRLQSSLKAHQNSGIAAKPNA